MAIWMKRFGVGIAWTLWSWSARAQVEGSAVYGFGQFLVGVSVLLIAVGLIFVLLKLARLIDVLIAYYEERRTP